MRPYVDMTESVRRKYNRFALIYDWKPMEMGRRWRKELWQHTVGKVLEVGVGTGENMQYYPKDATVTAIDFSERMIAKAEKRAKRLGIPVDLRIMDIQRMEFPGHSFDTVVGTCVFCTVPDPVRGMKEVHRVLRPGGRLILMEHVRSCRPVIGRIMDWLNPIVYGLIGTEINRNTVQNVKNAGFEVLSIKKLWSDILLEITAEP